MRTRAITLAALLAALLARGAARRGAGRARRRRRRGRARLLHQGRHTLPPGAPIGFYFTDEGIASTTATETATKGLFGIANVPEGPVVIEGDIPGLGKKLGRVQLFVNKDTISNLSLGPTPDP